jgi:hypothetical protein
VIVAAAGVDDFAAAASVCAGVDGDPGNDCALAPITPNITAAARCSTRPAPLRATRSGVSSKGLNFAHPVKASSPNRNDNFPSVPATRKMLRLPQSYRLRPSPHESKSATRTRATTWSAQRLDAG